ncbi:hypothetical protein [Zhongshania aquimaris]|uniref:Uncharacterized protein n=1 Tax=Zhongshania aquimaris TaxID=2857107 RepID=A0ABS6VWV8_9GAMM|nr:hypothetical protein [Zhongshania aquimaris]MBW2942840.1 hypothetical protein [Zhongshania aquimaris]
MNVKLCAGAMLASLIASLSHAEFLGYVGVQARAFPSTAADPAQGSETLSGVLSPEWYQQWNDGDDSFNIKAFYRYDSQDDERSHADLREFYWQHVGNSWELTVGVNTIFWGVTESQHLVDIINQTDFVEAPDGEDKLGQPMIHYASIQDWGVVDVFVLPTFREREFAGKEGRLRSIPITLNDAEQYQSDRKEEHIDYALRWSHYLGDWNVGLSWFNGTSREPLYLPRATAAGIALIPHYALIEQSGIDAQYVSGDWLWKLEAIYRRSIGHSLADNYAASTAGFEYTLTGINSLFWDLGLLLEYSYDSRPRPNASPFQNDIFVGGRLSLNDIASSEILFGYSQDVDDQDSRSAFMEASTRIGDSTRVTAEVFHFHGDDSLDPIYSLRRDSYIEIGLEYYY